VGTTTQYDCAVLVDCGGTVLRRHGGSRHSGGQPALTLFLFYAHLSMNVSPIENELQKISRFQDAIFETSHCGASFIGHEDCDLTVAKGVAYSFVLKGKPTNYPEARKCHVWDSKDFKPEVDNKIIVVFDIQVTSDAERLPFDAVWAWLSYSLVTEPDIYVKSKKWSKDDLHKESVWYYLADGTESDGRFFVRERADGRIAVRIKKAVAGSSESVNVSFPLTKAQVDRIIKPGQRDDFFTVQL
jgi:hypothetical protein